MTDPQTDGVILTLTLTLDDLCRAARLGGHAVPLAPETLTQDDIDYALLEDFAETGLRFALHESFERTYPTHYPDDIEDLGAPSWPRGGSW